ncbi:MAG: hypothetical protein WAX04_13620, partial [Oscillospiraceae bacterium]
ANVTNQDIRKGLTSHSYEEKLCLDLWTQLEKTPSIQNYRSWFQNFEKNTESMFVEMVEVIIAEAYQNDNERNMTNLKPKSFKSLEELKPFVGTWTNELLKDKAIIFHGFYFITPIQQRLIRALEKAGFTIIQLINYRKDYPSVFKTVESFLDFKTYPPRHLNGLPPIINQISNKFLGICEGNFNYPKNHSASRYYSFHHMYQFKRFIESDTQNNDFLISPRAREVRSHLEDTSSLANLQLKDYPIGQFLIDIHQINTSLFNEQTKLFQDQDQLSIIVLKRIFSSGYLYVEGKSTKRYIDDLEKISERLEYAFTFNGFEGKELTLDSWIAALENLIEDKKAIEAALTPDLEDISIDEAMYLYPNRFLSYFSVPIERLQTILKGFHQIKALYNMIFTGENIQLKKYLEDLQHYVRKEILPNIILEDEKQVAIQLLDKFESLKDDEIESFDRRDLIQGLRYFLSENVEDENSNSLFGESLLEGRVVSLQDGDFLPFVDNEHVHLAFIDNKSLPLIQNIVTWPFNDNSMNKLYETHKDLYLIKKRKSLDASITKYLIYLITQNASSIKFSSVSNFNQEQNLKPSFYIDLLDLPRGDIEAAIKGSKEVSSQEFKSETIQSKKRQKTHLLEMTKVKCMKRMTFSYLLQESPTYESDFHQRFVFNALLIRFLKMQKKYSTIMTPDEMKKIVFDWFPHWSQSKKDILAAKAIEYENSKVKYGNSKPEYSVNRVKVFDNLENVAFIGTKVLKITTNFVNPGQHCKY